MFELIYKLYKMDGPDDIIVFCRMKSMEEIIDNVVVKYNVPLSEENINDSCKDGFWIRELKEIPLVERVLDKYLHYQSHKQKLNDNLDDWLSKFKKKINL